MPVIRHAEAGVLARDAIVLDLGDLARQAEAMRAEAQRRADAIIAEAKAERERILQDVAEEARRAGREAGYAEGMSKGRADGSAAARQEHAERLEALDAAWSEALARHESMREELLREARRDVLSLAAVIAGKVVKRAIELDPTLVEDQLAAALAMIARPTRIVVAVHPEDEAIAAEALPRMRAGFVNVQHAELITDGSLSRGSCVVRTDRGGGIDASIQTQIERMVEVLLPKGGVRDDRGSGGALPPSGES